MRRLAWIVVGCACLYAAAAPAETARNVVPADCHDKQRLQLLSSGDPVAGDSEKVKCVVTYWACGQQFSQSQVVANRPDACERFTNSVRSRLGTEACCDCFPKCTVSDAKRRPTPPASSEPATAKAGTDCCAKVEQLEAQVKELEARLKTLEDRLTGDEVTLNAGGSSIKLKVDKSGGGIHITSDQDISINSTKDISISSPRNISIKAGGNIILKGTKIQQN
jgi:hypothetical protein